MNREILFRGKRIDNGEWIIGDLTTYTDTRGQKIYEILDKNNPIDIYIPSVLGDLPTQMPAFINVDETTIGQYTGLTDKNGTKIFEGDIVKYGNTIHKAIFEQRNGTAYFGLVYSEIETLPFGHYQDLKQIEVIGNIHDNPELLGE